jgi:hypothetical protein
MMTSMDRAKLEYSSICGFSAVGLAAPNEFMLVAHDSKGKLRMVTVL